MGTLEWSVLLYMFACTFLFSDLLDAINDWWERTFYPPKKR